MNNNILLLGLMLGALFFLKRQPGGQPVQGQMESGPAWQDPASWRDPNSD